MRLSPFHVNYKWIVIKVKVAYWLWW